MATIQKITPNFWFDKQAEEAVNFYLGIFKNSRILKKSHYGKEGFEIHHMPEGTVMTMEFELEGQRFLALNGGPLFKFNESISFLINCENQEEIDHYWNKLSEGGDPNAQQCGWLKDRFGLSWQVVPSILSELLKDQGEKKGRNTMHAMLQMKKLDIQKLKEAHQNQ
jgi:predicted 3-demethylubiquinone-9 3-methyltransferase (glyoxalase superfamily)